MPVGEAAAAGPGPTRSVQQKSSKHSHPYARHAPSSAVSCPPANEMEVNRSPQLPEDPAMVVDSRTEAAASGKASELPDELMPGPPVDLTYPARKSHLLPVWCVGNMLADCDT